MKRNSIYVFVVAILLTMFVLYVITMLLFPDDVYPYLVSSYIATIVLWLYAYRVSKKMNGSQVNPSI